MTDQDSAATPPAGGQSGRTPERPTAAAAPSEAGGDVLAQLGVTPDSLVRALIAGAGAYAIAWLFACAGIALVLLASVDDEYTSWWWLLTAPAQLVAMAFFSPAGASITSTEPSITAGGSFLVTAAPLTVLAVALVACHRLSARDEARNRSVSRGGALSLSLTTGLAFAVVSWVLALVVRLNMSGSDDVSVHAGRWQVLVIGTVLIAAAALAARRPPSAWAPLASLPAQAGTAARAALVHFAVFVVVALPVAIVWILVEGDPSSLLTIPLLLLNGASYAFTLGHFGALSARGTGEFLGQSSSGSETLWLFSDDTPTVLLLLVAAALVSVVASSLVLHLRSGGRRTQADWIWVSVAFATVGGVISLISRASLGGGASFGEVGGGATASFGPAAWFFLVMGVWGALTEGAARAVAPAMAAQLPSRARTLLSGPPPSARPDVETVHGTRANATPPPATGPAEPMSRGSKIVLASIGAVVALGVLAAIGVSVANKVVFGPQDQAKAYVEALADGDVEKAASLARLDYSKSERVLLNNEVYAETGSAITNVSVGDVEVQGDIATVTVKYAVKGAETAQDLTLVKRGSRFVLFNKWELEDPTIGELFVTAPGATGLSVNGEQVDVAGLDAGIGLPAFPGSYSVAPDSGSELVTYGEQEVTATNRMQSLSFQAQPTTALSDAVTKQALAFLSECLAKKEAEPEGCPNKAFYPGLTDISWKLIKPPTFEVQSDFNGGWTFRTADFGTAQVTGKQPPFFDGDSPTPYEGESSISLSGEVMISGDDVTLKIDDF